jgi:predicted amidohydrolase
MPERRSKIKVGLAQIDARLGDLEFNLAHHLEWIAQARSEGVELLLFPSSPSPATGCSTSRRASRSSP